MTMSLVEPGVGLPLNFRLALLVGLLLATLPAYVKSKPEPTFPFNAQVPPVARIGEPYNFTLSEMTFSSDERVIRYTIARNPAWLRIDPISRRLSGIPRKDDVGSIDFSIVATDNTGVSAMQARLVVASKPLQGFGNEFEKQLEQQASLSGPRNIVLNPSQSFELTFNEQPAQGSGPLLSFYATMADHSPLPSWIIFNNSACTFYGNAPLLEKYPRKYELLLIKSDILGYARATFEFSLIISDHEFRFIPQQKSLTVTPGASFEYTGFQDSLLLDGSIARSSELESVTASPPPNIRFDANTFIIRGVASSEPQTFGVIARDIYGNTAEATIKIIPGSEKLPEEAVTAVRGAFFEYNFPEGMFRSRQQDVEVQLGEASSWLKFDRDNTLINGHVPSSIRINNLVVAVKTISSEPKLSETFDLNIHIGVSGSTTSSLPSSSSASSSSPRNTKDNAVTDFKAKEKRHPSNSVIAIAVIVSFLALIIFVIFLIMYKKYRRKSKFRKALHRRNISLPMSQSGERGNEFDNSYTRDLEDSPGNIRHYRRPPSNPPQLPPLVPRRSSKRRTWRESMTYQNQEAEMVVPERKRTASCVEADGRRFLTDLKISESCCTCNMNGATFSVPQPLIVYPGDRHPPIFGDAAQVRPCQHCNNTYGIERRRNSSSSLLTRSLSVVSFTPSAFPAPPLRNKTFIRRSTPIPSKQNSIRIVPKTPSVSTLTDRRTIHEKRQSYIRARVSGRSPFFSAASYKKSSRPAYNHSSKVQSSYDWSSPSPFQMRNTSVDKSCSAVTRSPSLATAEREIEEFLTNYPYEKKDTSISSISFKRVNCEGFIKNTLEKLEGSSQYTITSEVAAQANTSCGASLAERQSNDPVKPVRPISTKVVDRPHPLVGRRNNTLRRKTRLKTLLYPSTSNLRKQSRTGSRYSREEAYFELGTKRGLGIVLDLNSSGRGEVSTNDCKNTTPSRSPLSVISNGSPKPRLVGGKGKRPVSVQGTKHEDEWGSLSGLRGNEAFI